MALQAGQPGKEDPRIRFEPTSGTYRTGWDFPPDREAGSPSQAVFWRLVLPHAQRDGQEGSDGAKGADIDEYHWPAHR